jgi:hypothetical protein
VRPGGIVCGHDYCDEFPDVKAEADGLAAYLAAPKEVTISLWSIRLPNNIY